MKSIIKKLYCFIIILSISFLTFYYNTSTFNQHMINGDLKSGEIVCLDINGEKKEVKVLQIEKDKTEYDTKKNVIVYLLEDQLNNDSSNHKTYLAIILNNNIIWYDIMNKSYTDLLYLCDVTGDNTSEIILHQQVDAFGGVGQYISRVFEFEDNTVWEIFNSKTSLPNNSNSEIFDTGFESKFLENYKLKIINKYTDYSIEIDISDRYLPDYHNELFDKNGKFVYDTSIWCDDFFQFIPKDIDGDNVFELECMQYVSLLSHTDGIGYAKSILKYNVETHSFEVLQAQLIVEGRRTD